MEVWWAEYLNELRECHRYSTAKKACFHHTVSPGDIVIIHDDSLPRGFWKLGQIQEIHTGRDGLPRSALVRVANRDRQFTLLARLLYPLEIGVEKQELPCEDVPVVQKEQTPTVPVSKERVVRAAATKARQRTRAWINELQNQD